MDKFVTLAFLVKNNQIILANKKKGFGKGFLNGYGGGMKEKESIWDSFTRELFEESGVIPKEWEIVGEIDFYKLSEKLCHCVIFFVKDWEGKPRETEEMGFPEEFFIGVLPFHKMWHGDRFWLPLLLAGKRISSGTLVYSGDMQEVNSINLRFW